jgi:hypothetical protein
MGGKEYCETKRISHQTDPERMQMLKVSENTKIELLFCVFKKTWTTSKLKFLEMRMK